MTIPAGIINPFSQEFEKTWELWKLFKFECFQFKYKGVISEQMALKHLVDLSDGEEQKAVKIVEQSIRREWQGFFPLKETTHGTRKKSNPENGEQPTGTLRERVIKAANKKFRDGEQEGDGSHLKAV